MTLRNSIHSLGVILGLLGFMPKCGDAAWAITLPVADDSIAAGIEFDSEGTFNNLDNPSHIRLELRKEGTLVSDCLATFDSENPNWMANSADHRLETSTDYLGKNTIKLQ